MMNICDYELQWYQIQLHIVHEKNYISNLLYHAQSCGKWLIV